MPQTNSSVIRLYPLKSFPLLQFPVRPLQHNKQGGQEREGDVRPLLPRLPQADQQADPLEDGPQAQGGRDQVRVPQGGGEVGQGQRGEKIKRSPNLATSSNGVQEA